MKSEKRRLLVKIRKMIRKVPGGNVQKALIKAFPKAQRCPQLKRIYFLCLLITSRKSAYQGMGFCFSDLTQSIKEIGTELGAQQFESNVQFLELIKPAYEILYKADLHSSKLIDEFTGKTENFIIQGLCDFIEFGFCFELWSVKQPYGKVFSQKGYETGHTESIETILNGGDASRHRIGTFEFAAYLKKTTELKRAAAKKVGMEKYSSLYLVAEDSQSFAQASSFKYKLVANEEWKDAFAMEAQLFREISGSQSNEDIQVLQSRYGEEVVGKLAESLQILKKHGLSLSVETSTDHYEMSIDELAAKAEQLGKFASAKATGEGLTDYDFSIEATAIVLDGEKNEITLSGPVPGAFGSRLIIKKLEKREKKNG